MKLPKALGLWPAFWMMPDRGKGAANRGGTDQGAMEIDIMEYLVRFGGFRYNIATHWDGYGKDHKSTGTERVYFQPDKDGYIVSGVLWQPGKITWYCNGQPVAIQAGDRVSKVPGYLMFTMPTGGWGTNGVIDEDKLPDTFDVKWVRCWQNREWAAPAAAGK
jgi:beta-glucanase (GH16 family)